MASFLGSISSYESRKISKAFRDFLRDHEMDMWQQWLIWKDKILLYPPEVRGYSSAARVVDTLIFKTFSGGNAIPVCHLADSTRKVGGDAAFRLAATRETNMLTFSDTAIGL